MAIHRYSQPSSGTDSYSSSVGTRVAANVRPIKEYGHLKECYYGVRTVIDTCHFGMNPGRRFYTCPNADDGDYHIWKWWEEAVMKEMTLICSDYGEVVEKMEVLIYLDDFYMAKAEIDELKQKQIQTDDKIANLEIFVAEMNKKKNSITIGLNMKIVFAAVVVIFLRSLAP